MYEFLFTYKKSENINKVLTNNSYLMLWDIDDIKFLILTYLFILFFSLIEYLTCVMKNEYVKWFVYETESITN